MDTTKSQLSAKSLNAHVLDTVRSYLVNLDGADPVELYKMVLEEVEVPLLEAVMERTKGNQSKAAHLLGLARGTLRTKLKKYFGDKYVGTRD